MGARAIVSLGSNIEPRADYLARALSSLAALPRTRLVGASSVIETEPVGVPLEFADRKFLNQVAVFDTDLAVRDFFARLQGLEIELGRVRTVRNGPRTIDLDLIDFGGLALTDSDLVLPHPRARERDFVLRPLAELGIAWTDGFFGIMEVMDERKFTFPGFIDVHVHFRDPGMPTAETTVSGLEAARRGGFAAVVTMPNTTPPIDTPQSVTEHRQPRSDDVVLLTSACITRGRLGREVADLEQLADAGAAFFTDDGAFVADDKVMEEAMTRIAALNMVVCQHAMTRTDGVIRDCPLARRLRLPIIPASVETDAIRRDLSLCRTTGCRLHIQHISTAEGVGLVRAAQREGLPVTAEATPHHLLLCCDDLTVDDANFKMAPPLGNREDRAELRRAVKDGVLMFATDHAPHPADRKNLGFAASANGIIGLETAIAITYGVMVEGEGMEVSRWAAAWNDMPRDIIAGGHSLNLRETSVSVGAARTVDPSIFASLSRNCPYVGMEWRCWPCK